MTVTVYSSAGTPSDSVGVQGDFDIDYSGKFLWGPKGASSWAGTAVNITGPTGSVGAAGPSSLLPTMNNFGSGYGPMSQLPSTSVTSGTAYVLNYNGTTFANTYTPLFASACSGLHITNYGSSAGACTVSLKDLTAGTTVFTSASVTAGTINNYSYGATAYPLVANHQYQWVVTPGSSGTYVVQIAPIYLMPSSLASALSFYNFGGIFASATASSGNSVFLQPPSLSGQTMYYKNAAASYLYSVTLTVAGSGPMAPYIYNGSASANQWATAPAVTLTSTPTTYSYGPFTGNAFAFTAGSYYQFGLSASGAAITVTSAYCNIQVGQ